jgi:hypothetical protein
MDVRRSWHRWSRQLAAGAALLHAMLEAAPASAAPAPGEPAEAFRVIETSSAGCGRGGTFLSELRRRTRLLRPALEGEHAILFVVETFENPGGVRGRLTMRTLSGATTVREVPGSACHDVESAMALIAALSVDPLAGSAERGQAVPAAAPHLPALETSEPHDLPAAPQQSNWSIRVEPRVTLRTAIAPHLAWGGAIGAMVTRERAKFLPSFGLSAHFSQARARQPAGSADLDWVAAQLLVCPWGIRPGESWDFRACASFQVGRLRGIGIDTVDPATKAIFWASAGAELQGRVKLLGPLWLGLDATLELPFSRERFYIEPRQTLHRVPWWGASLGLGVGVLFY